MSDYRFKDKEGNHLLVALSNADRDYKAAFLEEDDLETEVVEISLEKEHPEIPLQGIIFPRVAKFLLKELRENPDAVYYYTVSFEALPEEHHGKSAKEYRSSLFSGLETLIKSRGEWPVDLLTESKTIGKDEYATICKIFYRPAQTHIARMIINGIDNSK